EGHTHDFLLTSLAHPVLYARRVFPATVYSLYSVVELDERISTSPHSTKLAAVGRTVPRGRLPPWVFCTITKTPRQPGSGGGSEFVLTTFPVIVTIAVGFVSNRGYEDLSKGAAEVGRANAGRLAQVRGARARRARRGTRTQRPPCVNASPMLPRRRRPSL